MAPPFTESPQSDPPIPERAQEAAQEAADTAREQARNAGQEARERARSEIDQRTTDVGSRLQGGAGDARSLAGHLRDDGKDGPARIVEQAADHAESAGRYLGEADADRLIRDVEDYARRNPWAVIAGGLALGFAASRMLSASSASRSLGGSSGGAGPRRELQAPTTSAPPITPGAAGGAPGPVNPTPAPGTPAGGPAGSALAGNGPVGEPQGGPA